MLYSRWEGPRFSSSSSELSSYWVSSSDSSYPCWSRCFSNWHPSPVKVHIFLSGVPSMFLPVKTSGRLRFSTLAFGEGVLLGWGVPVNVWMKDATVFSCSEENWVNWAKLNGTPSTSSWGTLLLGVCAALFLGVLKWNSGAPTSPTIRGWEDLWPVSIHVVCDLCCLLHLWLLSERCEAPFF